MYHPVCHTLGTLDLVNQDAWSVLLLMPTYPLKLVRESRPLSAQHPALAPRHKQSVAN